MEGAAALAAAEAGVVEDAADWEVGALTVGLGLVVPPEPLDPVATPEVEAGAAGEGTGALGALEPEAAVEVDAAPVAGAGEPDDGGLRRSSPEAPGQPAMIAASSRAQSAARASTRAPSVVRRSSIVTVSDTEILLSYRAA